LFPIMITIFPPRPPRNTTAPTAMGNLKHD
jgi:hypothetical protein